MKPSLCHVCARRCDWLNNKNTIFGKIVGDTIYNMLRFNELEVIWVGGQQYVSVGDI